jgi:hypothetical protein
VFQPVTARKEGNNTKSKKDVEVTVNINLKLTSGDTPNSQPVVCLLGWAGPSKAAEYETKQPSCSSTATNQQHK